MSIAKSTLELWNEIGDCTVGVGSGRVDVGTGTKGAGGGCESGKVSH